MSGERGTDFSDVGDRPVLSVVATVLNEEDGVAELVRRVATACGQSVVSFEIIVVNDGSSDLTLPRLIELGRETPELRVIDLFRNFGVMSAVTAGLFAARGDAVVVLDGDLQDPPELIPQFVEQWRAGADVVYGRRTGRWDPLPVRIMVWMFNRLQTIVAETPITEDSGSFSLIDRRVADILLSMPERHRYFVGLRSWVGGKQAAVEYHRDGRQFGTTRQGLRGLFAHARLGLISFSKAPLRLASILSMVFALVLLAIGVGAVLIRLGTDLAIPGWATFTALLGGVGFMQSLVLGIIAEYLGAVFDEVKARPTFLIRDEYRSGERIAAPARRSNGAPPDGPPRPDSAEIRF